MSGSSRSRGLPLSLPLFITVVNLQKVAYPNLDETPVIYFARQSRTRSSVSFSGKNFTKNRSFYTHG